MTAPASLPPYPNGWYALARTDRLRAGALLTRRFMGEDVIVFRTHAGEACVMEAYCPHLGAHFGHGGKVVGDCVQCPFHHFEFDVAGTCTKTGYGTKPPPTARARVYPTRERNGVVLAYYDAHGAPPDWEIPTLDRHGWLPFEWAEWELHSHPQETSENSVDLGHFTATHGYTNVEMLTPPRTEGRVLTACYRVQREGLLSKRFAPMQITFTPHVCGLGFSYVEVHTLPMNIRTLHLVLSTPTDAGTITLRIASSLHRIERSRDVHPALRFFPVALLNQIISKQLIRGYKRDVRDDFKIWEHKKYLSRTPLAKGDGPIGLYRRWAKQFYPTEPATAR